MCRILVMYLVMHLTLHTTSVHASLYPQAYRAECEPLCRKIQEFSGYCPPYGSCQWFCQTKQTNCPSGTTFHCARDLNLEDTFTVACGQEIFCLAGEEPRISQNRTTTYVEGPIASVFCRPCFKGGRFNSRFNISSATYSECPSLKSNNCMEQAHKQYCINASESTKTDGYCRCDSRKGYAAQSEKMCFYDNKPCFKKHCPVGEELLLNYSCARVCPPGHTRTDKSDICQPTVTVSKVTTLLPTNDMATADSKIHITTIAEKVTDSLSSPQVVPKNIPKSVAIVLPTVLIGVVLVGIIWICLTNEYITEFITYMETCNRKRRRPSRDTQQQPSQQPCQLPISQQPGQVPPAEQPGHIHPTTNHQPGQLAQNQQPTQLALNQQMKPAASQPVMAVQSEQVNEPEAATEAIELEELDTFVDKGADSTEQDHFCKEIWQEFCNYVFGQERFSSETFLKRIETNQDLDLDSLKQRKINHDDPYFGHEYTAETIEGYTAFKKSPDESPCLYTWISYLLCGKGHMTSIIRLAAARFALQNFDEYVAWLTNQFNTSENSVDDATFFFKIHGVKFNVYDKSIIKIGVQLAFADLVKEIVNAGSGNGPFYVKFLSGALNCNIIQHYENDTFAGRKVQRIQCLRIEIPKLNLSDRELHIYWMKSKKNCKGYRVLRLYNKPINANVT